MKTIIDFCCYHLVLVWPLRWSVRECRFFNYILPRAGDYVYRDHDYGNE